MRTGIELFSMTKFQREAAAEANQGRMLGKGIIRPMLNTIRIWVLLDDMATFIDLVEGVHKDHLHIDMNLMIDEGAEWSGVERRA